MAKTPWLSAGERGRRRRRSVMIVSLGGCISGDDMVHLAEWRSLGE